MSDVKMNVVHFSKKLRARKAELQKQHAQAVLKFAKDFVEWRMILGQYLRDNAYSLAQKLTKEQVYKSGSRSFYNENWRDSFFENAPKRPKRPSDEIIKQISTRLKYLAITGQTSVMVSERDANLFFDTEPKSEDE
jgi:hypothetical protein